MTYDYVLMASSICSRHCGRSSRKGIVNINCGKGIDFTWFLTWFWKKKLFKYHEFQTISRSCCWLIHFDFGHPVHRLIRPIDWEKKSDRYLLLLFDFYKKKAISRRPLGARAGGQWRVERFDCPPPTASSITNFDDDGVDKTSFMFLFFLPG